MTKDIQIEEKDLKKEHASDRMGTAPIGKLLASMAWPAILSMTINALYNVVDSIFVARYSADAMTAISLVNPVQMLMISIGIGSAVGVNSLIARRLGARRQADADKAASTSIRIGIFNAILFALIGIFLAKPFMHLYTDNPVIFEGGVAYLQIITICSIFCMVQFQLEKVLQSTGNMVAPMIISLCGAIVNIILDPILIFGLFGMPEMGIAGAAVATVIGQAIAFTVAVYIVHTKEHLVHIQLRGFKMDWNVVKDIYAVGLPAMIMQSIASIMLFGYNAILAASKTAVAVLGIYFRLQSFIFMPVFGLNQGAMPIMGYNYGARNRKRLMKTYKLSLAVACTIMTIGFIVFQFCPEMLLNLFGANDEMLAMGVPALRIISICFIPASYGIITGTLFQATGHGVYSLMVSFIRQLVGILPIAYFLYNAFGVAVSWMSFPLAECLGLTVSVIMLTRLYKKEIKTLG